MQITILVTGKNGQLGSELQVLAKTYQNLNFIFTDRSSLDITNEKAVIDYFENHKVDFIINAAAYTAVDKAETEKVQAYNANALAPMYLAKYAKSAKLIHISTDYVFDGSKTSPYTETDSIRAINYYGETKIKGEQLVIEHNNDAIIIRTSWVYSSFGHNFVKTMLKLMATKSHINVVADQIGVPTYAASLAEAILQMILHSDINNHKGIFHFTNSGTPISWYQFAQAIATFSNSNCKVHPIPTTDYPTPATRSAYSALDTSLIKTTFNLNIPNWEIDLQNCLRLLIT
jgi:dTDP-4-dehydrorhamnose reductase